jgi:hypothetical protein
MTTVIPFVPSNIITPKFRATLDGATYDIKVTWNLSAMRYYINIYDTNGIWIITIPLISSPPARNVRSAIYDPFLNAITVTLEDPSQWPVPATGPTTKPGTIIDYTLEGFQPSTYNGKFRSLHLNNTKFTFPMPTNPGPLIILGRVSRLLNMAATVFKTSTLIYRNGSFEINP